MLLLTFSAVLSFRSGKNRRGAGYTVRMSKKTDGQGILGYNIATGHALERPLANFLERNALWVKSQGAVVSWRIVAKPWAQALVVVTMRTPEEELAGTVRQEINRRLVTAGFQTNLPDYDRHSNGHLIKDRAACSIEVLGIKTGADAGWKTRNEWLDDEMKQGQSGPHGSGTFGNSN